MIRLQYKSSQFDKHLVSQTLIGQLIQLESGWKQNEGTNIFDLIAQKYFMNMTALLLVFFINAVILHCEYLALSFVAWLDQTSCLDAVR